MKVAKSKFGQSIVVKLVIAGFLILLPMLAVGGAATGPAQAAAPLPAKTTQVDNDALASQYSTLVMRVYFKDIAERDALAYELSPEEIPTTSGYLTVIRDRYLYDNLKARGTRVEIDERMSRILSDPEAMDSFYNGYKTVEEMYTFLDQQAAAHPTLAQKVDIGDSWCKTHPGICVYPQANNGYDLYVMHITNQAISGPKPVFWADGDIHAREIATPEVVMRMIAWLLDNYNTNADAHWLIDYHDIWLMPTVNPDGHHIVEAGGGGNSPYLYRKNGNKSLGNCSIPPTSGNHFGVDNNRNFPFKWGCCGGSSTNPCDQTYRGTAAGGEEETAAIVAKIRTLIPDQRGPLDTDAAPITTTGVYQNIHTVVPVNLYPWGWTATHMPNYNEIDNIARRISSPGQGGNNYPYGCIVCELYVVDGGSIDWAYGELGIAAISTELGGNDFLPAFSCIDNPGCGSSQGIWPENRGMLTELAKLARTPYLLSHGPDPNTVATSPMTVTMGSPSQLTSTIKFNWTASDGAPNAFSQNVGAAEYYVDTPPWAGGTPVAMTPTDGSFNSPQEGAQATIDTTGWTTGRHIIFVRGRGQNDFSGYQTWGIFSAAFLDVLPAGGPTLTPTVTPTAAAPTSTNTAVPATNTATRTNTVVPATNTAVQATNTATRTGTAVPATNTATRTNTAVPATNTAVQATNTATRTGTAVPATNTATRTNTSVPATNTGTVVPATATNTSVPATSTPVTTATNTPMGTATGTSIVTATATETPGTPATPSATSTVCTLEFEDVLPGNTFYVYIKCLSCRGIINGYPCGGSGEPCNPNNDPYFRPGNNITRGQLAKVVSQSAGFAEPITEQSFEDVASGTTFFDYVGRLVIHDVMGGYPCGIDPGEPCNPPGNLPYFRPGANASRGQLTKIVSNAAGFTDPAPASFTFTDVPEGSTFHLFVERLLINRPGAISGYPCGGAGEPCDSENRPYFRPSNTLTRGQASKIVANTFFPECETPFR